VNLGHFFHLKKYFENRLPRLRQLLTTALHKPAAAFWPSRSKVCDPTAAWNYAGCTTLLEVPAKHNFSRSS
jgi:hypothetical protein